MRFNRQIFRVTSTKGTREGTKFQVEFLTDEVTQLDNIFAIDYEGKTYYFETIEIDCVDKGHVHVKAINVGYYNKFQKTNTDIRELLGTVIDRVEDKETINKIRNESGYL